MLFKHGGIEYSEKISRHFISPDVDSWIESKYRAIHYITRLFFPFSDRQNLQIPEKITQPIRLKVSDLKLLQY